ncbi:hypothetical protein BGX38DRAFT_1144059 [Terfezia claveryi]|nr:hypothetical protein BGX38DRAFT_1144059 [Terfezia claveryi]
MPVTPLSHFGPYSNDVIDHSDPAIIEFYNTFGMMMDDMSNNTPAPDMTVPNLLDNPAPTTKHNHTQQVNPTIEQATTGITDPNTEYTLDENDLQFYLSMHAAILGVTQEELTQMMANAPDFSQDEIDRILTNAPGISQDEIDRILTNAPEISQDEIDRILTNAPEFSQDEIDRILTNMTPLVENPEFLHPYELQEHASGNQDNNTLHSTTTDTSTVDPRLMLSQTHSNVPNAQPESAIHQEVVTIPAPTVNVSGPKLTPRALRALRRSLRQNSPPGKLHNVRRRYIDDRVPEGPLIACYFIHM